jgi:hypothetical protein
MHSSPYRLYSSPDAKAFVGLSPEAWAKYYPSPISQSDSESSSSYRFTSPEASGSPSEDTDSDAKYTMAHMPTDLPPQFRKSFLRSTSHTSSSNVELMELGRYAPQKNQASLSPSFTMLGPNGTPPTKKGKKSTPAKCVRSCEA